MFQWSFIPSSLCPPNSIFYKYITFFSALFVKKCTCFVKILLKERNQTKPKQKKISYFSYPFPYCSPPLCHETALWLRNVILYVLSLRNKNGNGSAFSEFSEQYFLKKQMQSLDELPQSFLRAHEKYLSRLIMWCLWHELISQKVNAILLNSVELTSE